MITASVVRQDVSVDVEGIGTVQAFNTVTVRARVDGQLEKVVFTEGQDVEAGQILAHIDPRPYEARLTQAQSTKARNEAQLANARLDLERFLKLGSYATQQSVETQRALVRQLEASVKSDQAAIDNATVELGYATVRAPIFGRTGVRLIDEGNVVRAGDMNGIVVIMQLQPISVVFSLPQQHLLALNDALSKGNVPATALDSDGKSVLEQGTLSVVDNRIDPQTGTVKLKATFANAGRKLWPGQFVNVRVQLAVQEDVVVVPAPAVQRSGDGTFVYAVEAGGRVAMRDLRISRMEGGVAVVESGIEVGEKVVVTSQGPLRPGAIIIESRANPPAGNASGGASPQIRSAAPAAGQGRQEARGQQP